MELGGAANHKASRLSRLLMQGVHVVYDCVDVCAVRTRPALKRWRDRRAGGGQKDFCLEVKVQHLRLVKDLKEPSSMMSDSQLRTHQQRC